MTEDQMRATIERLNGEVTGLKARIAKSTEAKDAALAELQSAKAEVVTLTKAAEGHATALEQATATASQQIQTVTQQFEASQKALTALQGEVDQGKALRGVKVYDESARVVANAMYTASGTDQPFAEWVATQTGENWIKGFLSVEPAAAPAASAASESPAVVAAEPGVTPAPAAEVVTPPATPGPANPNAGVVPTAKPNGAHTSYASMLRTDGAEAVLGAMFGKGYTNN